jgi:prepilin-type processing-associated H-X9-DG protein
MLAALGLGLSAGAMLAEAAVLVPYWRSLPAEQFLRWYGQNADRLVRFFGPLEVIAALLALAAAGSSTWHGAPGSASLWIAAALAVGVLLMFFAYFQSVNAGFADGSVAPADVADHLRRWSTWHWARTLIGVLSFLAALVAIQSRST